MTSLNNVAANRFEFIQEAGDFVWYHGVSAGAVMDTFISDEGTFIQGGGLERIAAPRESLVAYPKTVERLRSLKAS